MTRTNRRQNLRRKSKPNGRGMQREPQLDSKIGRESGFTPSGLESSCDSSPKIRVVSFSKRSMPPTRSVTGAARSRSSKRFPSEAPWESACTLFSGKTAHISNKE
jgi:hypothetical protein